MTQRKLLFARSVVVVAALVFAAIAPAIPAGALNSSSLLLSDPRPSETGVTYTFDSSGFATATSIACIDLSLNTQADGAGSAAATTTGFTLDSSTLITPASWAEDDSTNGVLRLTNGGGGENPAANGNLVFGGITNDATEGTTYYGIFTTYTDVACTGGNEVDQATVAFVLKAGELVQLTIDPTLVFTCSPVTIGQTVNGVTTTAASTASGIDHANNVTFTTNGISAHDINVATNATGGYTVYVRHTGLLTNGASDTIDNWTGTNATPTGPIVAGTESWGYTTEDATLGGGTVDRFTSAGGNKWSGFNTSNEPVIDNTGATSGTETTRVGHQVAVASTTDAGTYQTTIIYTVASVY